MEASTIYNNLGNIYADMEKFDLAVSYLNKCLDIRHQLEADNNDRVLSLVYLGCICEKQGNFETALAYFNRGLEMNEKIDGYTSTSNECLIYMAKIYVKLKNIPEAKACYKRGKDLSYLGYDEQLQEIMDEYGEKDIPMI